MAAKEKLTIYVCEEKDCSNQIWERYKYCPAHCKELGHTYNAIELTITISRDLLGYKENAPAIKWECENCGNTETTLIKTEQQEKMIKVLGKRVQQRG